MCLILGVLIIIFGYEVDIKSLRKKLKRSKAQVVTTTNLIIKNKQAVITQDKFHLEKDELPAIPLVKKKALTPDLSVINILHDLEEILFGIKTESNLLEPETIRDNEWFSIYPVKLSFRGEYKALFVLLNRVLQLPYLVVIEELELQQKKDAEVKGLYMHILLAVYKSKYDGIEDMIKKRPAEKLSLKISGKNVFECPERGGNLQMWSSRELRFLGLIKQAQVTFGVLSDPLGGIYRVKVSDVIGDGKSKITAIKERGIFTTNQADNIYREE